MVLSSSSGDVTFLLKKMILWEPITNLRGSEHMICEFQKQHGLDLKKRTTTRTRSMGRVPACCKTRWSSTHAMGGMLQ